MQTSFDKELISLCKVIGIYDCSCSCSCNWCGKFGCSVIVYCSDHHDHYLRMGHLYWHWRVLPAPLNHDENIHHISRGNYDDSEHVRVRVVACPPERFSFSFDALNFLNSWRLLSVYRPYQALWATSATSQLLLFYLASLRCRKLVGVGGLSPDRFTSTVPLSYIDFIHCISRIWLFLSYHLPILIILV